MGILDPDQTFGDLFSQGTLPPEQQPQTAAGSGLMDSLQGYKAQQAQMLEEHKDYGQRLERTAEASGQRGKDLHLVERVYTMLDERVPKGTKQFLYREMARTMGLDGKQGVTGEVGQMLTGLDPEGAGVLKTLINEQMKSADPGAIQGLLKGIMTGQLPMHEVTKMAGATAQQKQMAEAGQAQELGAKMQQGQAALPGMMKLGGPKEEAAAGAGAAAPSPEGMRPDVDAWKGIPPEKQPVEPEMNSYLGLEPGQRYTHDELIRQFPRLPSDRVERAKLREKLNTSEASTIETVSVGGAMLGLMQGRPEVLAQAGWLSQASEGVKSFLEAAGIGGPKDDYLRERAMGKIITLSGVNPNAVDAGVMRSLTENFAVALAKRNNPGRAPTDMDLRAAFRQIGASQSPEVFSGVVKSVIAHTYEADRQLLQTSVGARVELDPGRLNKAQIGALVESMPNMDKAYAQRLRDAYTGTKPAAPAEGAPAEGAAPAKAPAGKAEAHEAAVQQAQLNKQRQQDADRAMARAATINNDRRAEEQLGLSKDARALAERQEQRAIKNDTKREAKEKQDRIQQAFQALAKALGDGGSFPSMGGRGGGGGDQDARAFVMPARPQRQAPRIGK